MKPCFGYIRVSTAKQGEGASLDAQKDAITGFASQNGIEIVKWFEELETASKVGRPLFGDMLSELRRGKADGVVIHRIDRSARNYSDWARLDEVSRQGVKVYFAADSLDFDTRGGRLLADIQMALAADYSRNLSIEAKKGLYGRLKQGIYPFRAPIGYRDEGGGKVKSVDPIKAPLVKELFRLYLTGDYSLNSLTVEMQRRGLTGYYGKPVVRRNVETILKTPYYCGQILVMGKLYKGIHTPLITVAQFRRVQAIKANRSGKKSTKHKHLFRGLVQCGHCNRTLTGETQKGRVYYRCHTQGCQGKPIREDRLEMQIIDALQDMEISTKDQKHLEEQLLSWIESDGQNELEKSIKLRISDAQAKQDRLTDLLVDDAIDKAAFTLRKDNFTFEIEQLRGELATIRKSNMQIEDFEQAVSYATSLCKTYDCADPGAKRQLLKNSFARLAVEGGALVGEPAMWLKGLVGESDGAGVDIHVAVAGLGGEELLDPALPLSVQ